MAIHTPYDGSNKPFTIGLKPLDPAQWIDIDEHLQRYLQEKARLWAEVPEKIFMAEVDTHVAQKEVLALLADFLPAQYPGVYLRRGDEMTVAGVEKPVLLSDPLLPPLAVAAKLVQEDLVLMRRGAEDWRLAAASLCFPSAWNLAEKFGRPMHDIHQPVPGFGAGTRNADMISRMFDNLRVEQPVLRWNWSLHGDTRLHHPDSHSGSMSRFGSGTLQGRVFLRLERQTLLKLQQSGDILFTIRIYLDSLEVLEREPNGPALARAIDTQLAGLSAAEADYKGVVADRNRLSERLQEIAGREGAA